MATPNVRPNANNEGEVGTVTHNWAAVRAQAIYEAGVRVATLTSPAFSGSPTAPTPSGGDNSTVIATTAFVQGELTNVPALSGAMTTGNVLTVNASNDLIDSGYSPADLLSRANHSGTQAQSTITDLVGDLATITSDIAANAAAIAALPTAGHTHTSSQISDATDAATAVKVVIRSSVGQASFGNTGTSGYAIDGAATGTGASGVLGSATAGFGGYFSTDSSDTAHAALVGSATASSSVPSLWLPHLHSTSAAMLISRGLTPTTASDKLAEIVNTLNKGELRLYDGSGNYAGFVPTAPLVSDRTITIPAATGTMVLGDGTGVTDMDAFRNALGLRTTDTVLFGLVGVPAGGQIYWGSAELELSDPASTTTFRLPSGGGSAENLVDGDGRGITDAAAFRTAIGATSASSPSFGAKVNIDPSSGSDCLGLVGALGNTTTIAANASSNITLTLPTTAGILARCAAASGAIVATDITNSTATGQSLMTAASVAAARSALGSTTVGDALFIAASAAAARTTLDVAQASASAGYSQLYVSSSAATTIGVVSTYYVAESTTFVEDIGVNFSVPDATLIEAQYDGSETRLFRVTIGVSLESASSNQVIHIAVGLNGTEEPASDIIRKVVTAAENGAATVSALMSLSTNDLISLMVMNDTGANNVTVNRASMTVTPV